MPDVGRLYAETRGRITELVERLTPVDASRKVPPCPDWTVKDVLAHLTGVCADILEGRLEGVATDEWTARQVDERRGRPLAEILSEWESVAPRCEELSEQFPPDPAVQWLADLTTHEHDIRCALERPGARDSEAVRVSFAWLADAIGRGYSPAFRIVTPEGDDVVLGDDEPEATLRVGRFDAMRALTGRRSADQIAAFEWDGDAARYLDAFSRGPFRVAASPINE